jgi:hypothetical protein
MARNAIVLPANKPKKSTSPYKQPKFERVSGVNGGKEDMGSSFLGEEAIGDQGSAVIGDQGKTVSSVVYGRGKLGTGPYYGIIGRRHTHKG